MRAPHACHIRAGTAWAPRKTRPFSMPGPIQLSSAGSSVVAIATETAATSSPPTATDRSSFNGIPSRTANPIATASPDSAMVRPACRAVSAAASAGVIPDSIPSRNRLTASSA